MDTRDEILMQIQSDCLSAARESVAQSEPAQLPVMARFRRAALLVASAAASIGFVLVPSVIYAPTASADDCATLSIPNYVPESHAKSCGKTNVQFVYHGSFQRDGKTCYSFGSTQWNPCALPHQSEAVACPP